MGNPERGQSFLHTADAQAVKDAIVHRASGGFTPLFHEDSGRLSTNSLLDSLYKESDQEEQEKIEEALNLLLVESVESAESIAQKKHELPQYMPHFIQLLRAEFTRQGLLDIIFTYIPETDFIKEDATLLLSQYEDSKEIEKEKIQEELNLLLVESVESIEKKNLEMLRLTIISIGQLQTEFSHQVAIDFLLNSTENPNIPDDTDVGWTKGMVTAVLAGRTKDSQELTDAFSQWYWSDPITIGNDHGAQLLTGLIERNPQDLPKLLERLVSINKLLPEKNQFRMSFVWMNIIENCPEDVFQKAMSGIPVQFSVEYQQLREENPKWYSYSLSE